MGSTTRLGLVACLALLLVCSVGIAATTTVSSWSELQAATAAAQNGDTVILTAGTYAATGTVTVLEAITIDGSGSTVNTSGSGYLFLFRAAGTLKNFNVNKTDKTGNIIGVQGNAQILNNSFVGQYVPGDVESSRAVEVSGGHSVTITGNTFNHVRQPAYINNNVSGVVADNFTTGTKGWVVCPGGTTVAFTDNTFSDNVTGDTGVTDLGPVTGYTDICFIDGAGVCTYDPIAVSAANNHAVVVDKAHGASVMRVVNTTQGKSYTAIQPAINEANSGDTIECAAGTYNENLNINKKLTLKGPNANINPNTGNRVSEAIIRCAGGGDGANTPRADGITLEGFTFSSTGWVNIVPANVSGLVVSRNIFSSGDALYTEGRLTNVTFTENRQVGGGTCLFCSDIDGATITDNLIKSVARGVNIGNNTTCKNVTISGNTFDTNSRYAIQMLIGIQNVSIKNNEIINTTSSPNTSSFGIAVAGNGSFPGPLAITNNRISAADIGLYLADSSVAGNAVTVTGNTFSSYTATFINFRGTGTLTALKTTNTYDGATDDAAIEAKVYHDVDDASLGHVNWGQNGGAPATACVLAVGNVSGTVGQTVQLNAKLTSGGVALAGQSVAFSVAGTSVANGTTDAAGVAAVAYGPLTAGDKTITAKFSGVSPYKATTGSNTLTVTAAAPTAITLTLEKPVGTPVSSVVSGEAVTCKVLGDNGEDLTSKCTYYAQYGAGGSWSTVAPKNIYTAAKAGTWNLTAVYNTLTDSKPLTVAAGAATTVTLSPTASTVNVGDAQAYVVTATDAAGNVSTPAAADISWSEDGAGSFAGYAYTAVAGDAGKAVTITATVGAVTSAAATLNVNAAAGGGNILAWDKDTKKFYLCSNATNPQAGTEITGSGLYDGITVVVSGTGTNVTVTAGGASLQVTWYLRSGSLYRAYQYSTNTSAGSKTATFDGSRTLVDGIWKSGFYGLTHTISGGSATYGSAQQQ